MSTSESENRFLISLSELSDVLRNGNRDSIPGWVWYCIESIRVTGFPKGFPSFNDPLNGPFFTGFIIGALPWIQNHLIAPDRDLPTLAVFAVTPPSDKREVFSMLSSPKTILQDFSENLAKPIIVEFFSYDQAGQRLFAEGLLAGVGLDKIIKDFQGTSSTTLLLNMALWVGWREVAEAENVPAVYEMLENAFTATSQQTSLLTLEAFKQHAHRSGLSQYLAAKKRREKSQ